MGFLTGEDLSSFSLVLIAFIGDINSETSLAGVFCSFSMTFFKGEVNFDTTGPIVDGYAVCGRKFLKAGVIDLDSLLFFFMVSVIRGDLVALSALVSRTYSIFFLATKFLAISFI